MNGVGADSELQLLRPGALVAAPGKSGALGRDEVLCPRRGSGLGGRFLRARASLPRARLRPLFAVGLVFAGCCSHVIFLELLVRKHPGCGNIVTFAPFLFIAVEGFLFEANLGRKLPAIPIRYYVVMVTMFFTVSVVNNYALNLNIAMPLHMIFRSASTAAQTSEQRLTVV